MAIAWNGWNALLAPAPPWAHLVVAAEREAERELRVMPGYWGVVLRAVRGSRCGTKRDMLREWAAALQFPWYFGENWDAFEECINDLSWLPARGYVVAVTHADRLLRDADDFATLMQILDDAATRWMESPATGSTRTLALPVSFHVVFHCEPPQEAETRARCRDAGIVLATLHLPDNGSQ